MIAKISSGHRVIRGFPKNSHPERPTRDIQEKADEGVDEEAETEGTNTEARKGNTTKKPTAPESINTQAVYWPFDARRIAAIVIALLLCFINITLIISDYAQHPIYEYVAQYNTQQTAWKAAHNGDSASLLPTDCAFYESSSVPINVAMGLAPKWGGEF